MLFVMMIHRIKIGLPFGACSRWIPAAQRNW